MWQWILPIAIALPVAALVTRAMIWCAPRLGCVDAPGGRKRHARPMPRLGGAGILAGGLAAVAALLALRALPLNAGVLFSVTGVLAALVGLVDDTLELRPMAKIVGLLVIGAVPGLAQVVLCGARPAQGLALAGATLFFANAVNLLDNCDGASASVGTAALASFAGSAGEPLCAAAAASIAGFLMWNWPPARIFMGDTGSLLIGAWCGLLLTRGAGQALPCSAWQMLPALWVPLYDTLSVIAIRAAGRRSLFTGGHDHFSSRLMRYGMSNGMANLALAAGTLAAGAGALWARPWLPPLLTAGALGVWFCLLGAGEIVLTRFTCPHGGWHG